VTARFAAPTTLDAAVSLLLADPAARAVAGGTDLVVAARQGRRPLPESIVAINRIMELSTTQTREDGSLVVGALTSHALLAAAPEGARGWTALADAAAIVGSPATRATGTLGGNLMNASPAAETTAPLVAFDAMARLVGPDGRRRDVPVGALASAPGRTVAEPAELLTEVAIPAVGASTGSAYIRLEFRRAMEIAIVGAAALVVLSSREPDASIVSARIALTAVAPTIVRARTAEDAVAGQRTDPDVFRAAGAAAARDAKPIDDLRASADYRRAMLEVVVGRALAVAALRARGASVAIPASRWVAGGGL